MPSPPLTIQFTKRPDGAVVLRYRRADGSVVWQRYEGSHARFFPYHDLSHLAVEAELGITRGFYGLLAEGWEVADLEGKGARGPLPPESVLVEFIVSLFDSETAGGAPPLPAPEFNAQLAAMLQDKNLPAPPAFSDARLAAVRHRRLALHAAWDQVPPGASLEVPFAPTT